MKKIALTVAALALTAGSALAADLPSRKGPPLLPPPPPPPPMWTGFYVGLNAGGTWANSNLQTIGVGPVAVDPGWGAGFPTFPAIGGALAGVASAASVGAVNSGNNGGFIGGGQIGYNWQFYTSLVAGIEADIQGVANNSGNRTFFTGFVDPLNAVSWNTVQSARANLQYIGTVRGRLGWLFTPTLLVYGTGGLAYGGLSLNTSTFLTSSDPLMVPAFGGVNFSNTQVGWTAGGGLEWMFWPNWSAKVEYLYYDLGTIRQNFALVVTDNILVPNGGLAQNAAFGGQVRARVNGNIVRAGVNYHFNWGSPAPVVAKY